MNFALMMKQAQQVQGKIEAAKSQLAEMEFSGSSGGGSVSVVLTGQGVARRVGIDPALLVPGEKDVLEDLLVAAINDAHARKEQATADAMKNAMGGLTLPPGINLPF